MHSCSVESDSLRPQELYAAHQAPLSTESSRQEYWSGLPFPPPGKLPHPGTEPPSLAASFFLFFTTSATWEAHPKEETNYYFIISIITLDRAGIRDKWLAKSHRPSCLEGSCVGLKLCFCCFKFLKFFFFLIKGSHIFALCTDPGPRSYSS